MLKAMKSRTDTWSYIKLKSSYTAKAKKKRVISRINNNPQNRRKIFGESISDMTVISKIYKELLKLKTRIMDKVD